MSHVETASAGIEATDLYRFQYAATYLQQRYFVVPKGEGYISHPVITGRYLNDTDPDTRYNIFRQAIALVYQLTPKSQQEIEDRKGEHWPLLKHVTRLLSLWDDDKKRNPEDRRLSDEPLLVDLARLWAKILIEQGMWDDAIWLLEQGLDVAVSVSRKDDVKVELKLMMEWMVGLL